MNGLHRSGDVAALVFQLVGKPQFLAQPDNALGAPSFDVINREIQRRGRFRTAAGGAGRRNRSHAYYERRGGELQLLDHASPQTSLVILSWNHSASASAGVIFRNVCREPL